MTTPSSAAATLSPDRTEKGMILMVIGMLLIPGIDGLAKILMQTHSPGQIAAARFLFQALFLLPIAWFSHGSLFTAYLGINALRGLLLAGATLFFFWSLYYLPLADAIAIFFVEPLLLTLISALFLGETVGWRRLSAVVVGFLGAMIVIRPSFAAVGPAALLPLAAALCFALYLTATKRVVAFDDALVMQFWAGLFGTIALLVALVIGGLGEIDQFETRLPNLTALSIMAAMGAIATTGHILIVHAFRHADAGLLAPFQYLEIIGATLLGLLIFDDFPDPITWLGIAIIVASGLYVFHRERVLARTIIVPADRS